MELASLGSGSRGNATLLRVDGFTVLLDCGFSLRELERRLSLLGLTPADLDAAIVSHEHQDHIGGVGPLARRYGVPVWTSRGTWRNARDNAFPNVQHFRAGQAFGVGALEVLPYTVPHDSAEACQFVFSHAGRRLGVLTDCGRVTPHIVEVLRGCDGMILECNHDPQMLREGPYPPALQARVSGDYGHLSNQQAAGLLAALGSARPERLWLAHLSEQNNAHQRVEEALAAHWHETGCPPEFWSQDGISGWIELSP